MADRTGPTASRLRQTRKSIAHLPTPDLSVDKENITMDPAALSSMTAKAKQAAKKSRSKSLGPGGLDALKEGSGNQGRPSLPRLKSILKATVSVSPPKLHSPSNSKNGSPNKRGGRKTPESSPSKAPQILPSRNSPKAQDDPFQSPKKTDDRSHGSPSKSPTRVALRTEEEQQAAAREKERQELQAQKEDRRKSQVNRRVSFAPEATLHTWNVVELQEDSTTSSASTNTVRRASNVTSDQNLPYGRGQSQEPSSDASEPPSTPQGLEEMQVARSPEHQRDLHQKKRRRSSTVPPMNFNDPNQLSSSPFSGDSEGDDDTGAFETAEEGSDSMESDDDKDLVEEETLTNVDGDETTFHSTDSTTSSGRLDAALQQAASQAGTQGIEYDENGDMTMEMANDEVTDAFKPWAAKNREAQAVGETSAFLDQENINPFSPAFKARIVQEAQGQGETEEATMEITQAMGSILPSTSAGTSSPKNSRRKSLGTSKKRRSSVGRRRSSGDAFSIAEDQTMDLTTTVGGIQDTTDLEDGEPASDPEEMTMEFTAVVGGVVQSGNTGSPGPKDCDAGSDMDMDFTYAAGGILPPITERTEPLEDQTMEMDVTSAIGSILPKEINAGDKMEAKALMERQVDAGQLPAESPFHDGSPQKPRELPRDSAERRSSGRVSLTPKSRQVTPVKKPATPSKKATPQPARPTTPGKTPPSKNVTLRSASPKKLFQAEISSAKNHNRSALIGRSPASPFLQDPVTGRVTPSEILRPRKRRSSGFGIDREGLGSPRVTALLDRRASIGEAAKPFVPRVEPASIVRFEDLQEMEKQIDHETAEEKRRENGRNILEQEADAQDLNDDKDVTANLKDMIDSLSPQKKKTKPRKSLHVGAAKGLLGKRPAELDDDGDEDNTPKRLKGRESSPIKKVKLPPPVSKATLPSRVTRSTRQSQGENVGTARLSTPSTHASPLNINTTPKDQSRFKNAEAKSPLRPMSFEATLEKDDRIHLQDFLNMTGIRFMELTTTKRRQTVVPNSTEQFSRPGVDQVNDGETANDLEMCIVAGACTVPMLELYQHSCRELKNYISEGRKVVKEIEEATFDDNPPLFREYISAPADVRPIMDNQFKNVKTNARLLSKGIWYEWRMKLLEGLKEGLFTTERGMQEDDRLLAQQEQLLQPVLPHMSKEHEKLFNQVEITQAHVEELAGCDQEELKETREQLASVEQDLERKRHMIKELQDQLREREDALETTLTRKQYCAESISEAERLRDECRGWSVAEVAALQLSVSELEATHGWLITSASGNDIAITYDRAIQLLFSPAAFSSNSSVIEAAAGNGAPISLTYIADADEHHPRSLKTEQRFFLQIIRAQLQCLQQSRTKPKNLLAFVSGSWDLASSTGEQVGALGVGYIIEPTITADEVMSVRSTIFIKAMRTKVEVTFEVKVRAGEGTSALGLSVKPCVKVCYGEALNEKKMSEFVDSRIKAVKGYGVWAQAMRELEERLLAKVKKV
ncbi:uncharacterized protein KY384_001947 [Bacidia gigantensis]|uniref:uncharacterized protein n=1 Tax=Bacidia gigantensis TaxID=2732470 RepID=UPI001D0532A4|nr:uncharacterized protein KY384_001947 [Bacidia gigantensis]KAG8533164.1 hypothetical protein KY384_001947 [Bacidia gigantensis]